jgi:hypothetical protein
VVGDAAHVEPGAVDDQPRPRLLDRISSLGKS